MISNKNDSLTNANQTPQLPHTMLNVITENLQLFYKFLIIVLGFFVAGTAFAQEPYERFMRNYIQRIPFYFPIHKNDLLRMSSPYGYRKHPIHNKVMLHHGIDLAADKGKPVYATAAGTIEIADYEKGYGNRIVITHLEGVKTLYGHLWIKMVDPGETVLKGQLIGFVGDTGKATGPHLHYEVWINDKRVDPMLIWEKFIKERQDKELN